MVSPCPHGRTESRLIPFRRVMGAEGPQGRIRRPMRIGLARPDGTAMPGKAMASRSRRGLPEDASGGTCGATVGDWKALSRVARPGGRFLPTGNRDRACSGSRGDAMRSCGVPRMRTVAMPVLTVRPARRMEHEGAGIEADFAKIPKAAA